MVDGESRDRRQQLVEAAYARVAEVGFEGLRLRQIAVDVGLDHSTLYYYLPTKQDVIKAVAQYATDQLRPTMPDDPDPVAALRGHLETIDRLYRERPALPIVTAELDLRSRRDPEIHALMQAHEAGWRAGLAALLERCAEHGSWSGLDRDTAVELVIATVKGARHLPASIDQVLGQLLTLLTRPAGPAAAKTGPVTRRAPVPARRRPR